MGLFKLSTCSCTPCKNAGGTAPNCETTATINRRYLETLRGQPNPTNFQVLRAEQRGQHVVAEVLYPDAHNWEGRKILLYESVNALAVLSAGELDPHFCNNPNSLSPVARFEPTERGWAMAIAMADVLMGAR